MSTGVTNTVVRSVTWKLLVTVIVLVAFVAPLFFLGYIVAKKDLVQYSLTVAILLAGGALGWVVGIFISPLPEEGAQFQSYAKAVAAGVSGYALAKVDPILSELLKPLPAMEVERAFRLLGFLVSFIVTMLGAFGWRRYT